VPLHTKKLNHLYSAVTRPVRNLDPSLSIIESHPSEGKEEQESRTWEDILPRVQSTANLDGREKEGNKDADIGRQSAMHIGS